jgi:hypothetical protein
MMTVLSIKDRLRANAWFPFFIMSMLDWFPMLIGFGYKMHSNAFADNIISNCFRVLSFAIWFSGLILGRGPCSW